MFEDITLTQAIIALTWRIIVPLMILRWLYEHAKTTDFLKVLVCAGVYSVPALIYGLFHFELEKLLHGLSVSLVTLVLTILLGWCRKSED
ncbi:hypothetical protein LMH73_014675 [Vibrio splendidus]|nr:hypothetical protein [Vibrio splendidus]MCC4882918.1 hypothetical protein [Vibrio splendidus]